MSINPANPLPKRRIDAKLRLLPALSPWAVGSQED